MAKEVELFSANGGRFIDPRDCGSNVAWMVTVRGHKAPTTPLDPKKYRVPSYVRLDANIGLADCSRRISWDVSGSNNDLVNFEKIDAAIAELTALRAALEKASAIGMKAREEYGIKDQSEEE